jgi:hypothetical protein
MTVSDFTELGAILLGFFFAGFLPAYVLNFQRRIIEHFS